MRKKLHDYPVDKPCEFCGESFACLNSTQVARNRYCTVHRSRNKSGTPKGDTYARGLLETTCADCGAKCQQHRAQRRKGKIPRCRKCARTDRQVRARARRDPSNTLDVSCVICGHKFARKKERVARSQVVTCSVKCRGAARTKGLTKIRRHLRVLGKFNYGEGWRKNRRLALLRDSATCQKCGDTKTVEVHHIVRFRDFCVPAEANDLSNLVVLCRKHHREADSAQRVARRVGRHKLPC